MNLKTTTAFFSLIFFAESALANSLYLKCTTISVPDITIAGIYTSPPANIKEQVMHDMLEAGIMGLLLPISESWVVNISEKTIHSPETDSSTKFNDATIEESKITADHYSTYGSNYSWHLNRVTGKLINRVFLKKETLTSWHQKHGGNLPTMWQWEQQCTGSSKPAL